MHSELGEYYLGKPEPLRSCLLAVREIVLDSSPRISEARKYGMPFFLCDGKLFCYFWKDKKTEAPYLGVMEGRNIEHPLLEQGDRARVKIIRLDPEADLPIEGILEVLELAMACY